MSDVIFKSGNKYFKEAFENGRLILKEVTAAEVAAAQATTPKSTLDQVIAAKVEAAKQEIITSLNLKGEQDTGGFSTVETVELHDAATFEYEAEKFRWMGQSGLIGTRQYTYGGPKAYHRPFDVSYNPMNFHTHADYLGLQGMAEIVLSMNGYYMRTRHNDYRDAMPHSSSSIYQATERVPRPTVPASVSGTVANQRSVMQDLYTRAYNTMQSTGAGSSASYLTSAERQLFRWDMAYAECWWEILTDGNTSDPGNATRHVNASNDVREMLREAQYYNYGGHKNRFENTGYWIAAIKEVNMDGTPSYAVLKFRILTMPVATLNDYLPYHLFDPVKDYKALMRGGYADFTALSKSSWGRFKVKEGRDGPGLLDTLVNKIPGLDNGPANITETYSQYGITETIYNMTNSAVNNAGKYFRFSYILSDASGRDMERRGFNDPYMFVAMNTRQQVKKHTMNGVDYRFSYMIPLEMLLRHPLETWNPYGIPEVSSASSVSGDGTAALPYSAVNENAHWYLTPSSFFDARIASDAADTIRSGRYYKGADGVAYNTAASGTYIFLPAITNSSGSVVVPADGIRTRWPIYPCFHEGSFAFAEVQALHDYIAAGKTVSA